MFRADEFDAESDKKSNSRLARFTFFFTFDDLGQPKIVIRGLDTFGK
jgi:hypothetical protein